MLSNNGKSILVVDDNDSIRSMVRNYLGKKGYAVIEASDGVQGLEKGLSLKSGVIVLDVMMPGMDGFKVCHLLREKGVTIPILMLTERTGIEDKVTGFTEGADDYLGKPFDPVELELRIQALFRREPDISQTAGDSLIKRGDLELDLKRHKVKLGDREVLLTPMEFSILRFLASNPGHVYSRQDILAAIWETAYEGYKRNIDPHVNRLRTKIEENPKKPKHVLTVWGVGYKFNEAL
jgi:two-component system, OmpR family, alkaline phosphatase synthesis response regulator PhoP